MNYAVVGTGYWGENHVRVGAELREEGTVDRLVICDTDERRAAELAETYGCPYVTDHRELSAYGIDAATVATPSPTHEPIATDLLDRGIDLLVEKPLALDAESAWRIVERARDRDAVLAVGHIFRHHPALDELKRRIDRGELGRIKYLDTSRFAFRVPRETTGVLYSLAVHDVDIYGYLLGEDPDQVFCRADSFIREDVPETATIVLEYGDVTGVIASSWQIPAFGKQRRLTVVGSKRTAAIDYLEDTRLELYDAEVYEDADGLGCRNEGRTVHEVDAAEPLKVEIEDFLDASERRAEPRAPGRIGAKTVELLEYAEESAASGETVPVERTGRESTRFPLDSQV